MDILMTALYWFFVFIAIVYLSLGFLYTVEIPRLIVLFTVIITIIGVVLERGILDRIEYMLMEK